MSGALRRCARRSTRSISAHGIFRRRRVAAPASGILPDTRFGRAWAGIDHLPFRLSKFHGERELLSWFAAQSVGYSNSFEQFPVKYQLASR